MEWQRARSNGIACAVQFSGVAPVRAGTKTRDGLQIRWAAPEAAIAYQTPPDTACFLAGYLLLRSRGLVRLALLGQYSSRLLFFGGNG